VDEAENTSAPIHRRLPGLRRDNLIVGLIHLIQVIVLVVLSNDFSLPITESFLSGPPGITEPSAPEVIWDVPLGLAVAAFLALAALDHLLMAAPGIWEWYRRNLERSINYARWWEYSVSASLMIVLIALLTGISDVTALVAIFGVNAAMIFFGMLMEIFNPIEREDVNWTPYLFGCIAGAVPWIAIAIALFGAQGESDGQVPNFVFGIFVSLFILFNSFAINMLMQYRRVGRWRDYLFGERAYIVLSLTAKTALAWQIFANTLID
jgi:hypothetical protein